MHEKMLKDVVPLLDLIKELAQIAKLYGMQLKICSQKDFLTEGVEEAQCVDAERLERVSGNRLVAKPKLKGNRKECGCFASKDIGEYDTCPHGCVYCYAVHNRDLALSRFKKHEPASEFLFTPTNYVPSDDKKTKEPLIIPLTEVHKKSNSGGIVQKELF